MDAEHQAVTDSMRELGAALDGYAKALLAALELFSELGRALVALRHERQPIPGSKAYRRGLRR